MLSAALTALGFGLRWRTRPWRAAQNIFSPRGIPERLKGEVYAGGVLVVMLYGCGSWGLTAELVQRLANLRNKRVRKMFRVTMQHAIDARLKYYFRES